MSPNTFSSERAAKVNWLSGLEAFLVFSLILTYIWWLRFHHPLCWIPMLGLVIASHAYHHETFEALGFRWNGTPRMLAEFSVALGAIALLTLSAGFEFGTIRPIGWEGVIVSLALYCGWGLFQQYLLNGYFVNRFRAFMPNRAGGSVSTAAALLFSLAHAPNWFLMVVTFAGGYLCARIYLRHRNLYSLGMAHGVVGFLIYLAVPDTISHHLYVGPKWFSM